MTRSNAGLAHGRANRFLTGRLLRPGLRSLALLAALCCVASAPVTIVTAIVTAGSAYADEPVIEEVKKPTVDAADVYLGNAGNFHKPAEVDANAVYAEISEYKKILEDDIEPGSARYELLMNKASRRFKAALRKVARSGSYDLVARSGAVKDASDVPDVTQDVIDQL